MGSKSSSNPCLLLLVKYPQDGHVKTRLMHPLSATTVSHLYTCFVIDMVHAFNKTDLPFIIYYTPPSRLKQFVDWLGRDLQYLPQKGQTLGERLMHGFQSAFHRGYTSVVAVASDLPDLSPEILCTAMHLLDHADTVIGPCFDGGYYLIGFTPQSYHPRFFTEIPWSTTTVFRHTLQIMENAQLSVRILPLQRDIDTFSDLQTLAHNNHQTPFTQSHTRTYLQQHHELLS